MLILCIGPDTFRAQEKAHELELAFRKKFDLGGSSMERLSNGKDAIKQVLERANTASLFSPRRMMRTADLLLECPKSSQPALIQALSKDPENVIVISVESEMPASATMKAFESIPKLIKYEYPVKNGTAFNAWVQERAKILSYQDTARIERLAQMSDGDSWLAWNELLKLAAGSEEDLNQAESASIYASAEEYLKGNNRQHGFLSDANAGSEFLATFLSQSRAAIRVRDRDTEGIHPYVIKKMQALRTKQELESIFAVILHALLCQRFGFGTEEEVGGLM